MKIKSLSILLFISIIFIYSAQSQNEWQSKIDPAVLKKINTSATTEFVVVMKEQADLSGAAKLSTKEEKGTYVYKKLTETAERTQPEVLSLLIDNNVKNYEQFWIANVIWVKGDLNLINKIATISSVDKIIDNATYTFPKPVEEHNAVASPDAIEWNITKVNAEKVWALGYTGQNVVVAGEDTGYDWTHPAIKGKYRGWNGTTANHNFNWHDAIHTLGSTNSCGVNLTQPCDDYGHGTHTMGTMVGDDGTGDQIGMAPGAKWIGCRNMDNGNGSLTTYIECFQFFMAPTDLNNSNANPSIAPHVINNSWACPLSEGCNSSNFAIMDTVITNLKKAGIVVVVSAGNDGDSCSTIMNPAAIYDNNYAVAATDINDSIAHFSSRGPVTVYTSTKVKPDISAPGVNIRSCVPGGSYEVMDGTSMAGPHVAGLVALIISANPSLAGNVDSIEKIINKTAVFPSIKNQICNGVPETAIPNYTFGHGRIDALAAVTSVLASIKENAAPSVNVKTFPNPFINKITFELTNWRTSTNFKLYNVTGQVLINKICSSSETKYEFDLSSLPSGIYFYKIENEKNNFEGKITKILN